MTQVFEWVKDNPIGGPFVVILVTAFVVIIMGPYSMFGVGTGYAFTRSYDSMVVVLTVGTVSVFLGALLGGIIAFVFGRYLCRSKIKKISKKNKILNAIDSTMETQGLKLVFLLRLSLLVPFNFSNYAFGGTAIKIGHFILGTLGLLPMALFWVYIGTTASNI